MDWQAGRQAGGRAGRQADRQTDKRRAWKMEPVCQFSSLSRRLAASTLSALGRPRSPARSPRSASSAGSTPDSRRSSGSDAAVDRPSGFRCGGGRKLEVAPLSMRRNISTKFRPNSLNAAHRVLTAGEGGGERSNSTLSTKNIDFFIWALLGSSHCCTNSACSAVQCSARSHCAVQHAVCSARCDRRQGLRNQRRTTWKVRDSQPR
jgi:hypothetical protein